MNKNKIIMIIEICFMLLGLIFLQLLFSPKYIDDIQEGALIQEYYDEIKNHDVLFIGDCEVYETFSPKVLWEEYGIHSYIRGSAQQLIWQSYYLLKESLELEEHPKVVIFNVLSMKYNEPQKESYNRMTLDGMKWSSHKLNSVLASKKKEEKLIEYVFPILRYHSRWKDLNSGDFKYLFSKEKVSNNGYLMNVNIRPVKHIPDPPVLAEYRFGENSYKYLDMMVKLCKEKNVELILIKAPSLFPYWYKQWDEQITEYANINGIKYINFLDLQKEIGIDYTFDTYDSGLHLNLYGSEKMSMYLGKVLKEEFSIEDHSNDIEYQTIWKNKIIEYNNKKNEMEKNRIEE